MFNATGVTIFGTSMLLKITDPIEQYSVVLLSILFLLQRHVRIWCGCSHVQSRALLNYISDACFLRSGEFFTLQSDSEVLLSIVLS